MPRLIATKSEFQRILRERRRRGAHRNDEVWDVVYVMSPDPNNEHQHLAYKLATAIDQALGVPEDVMILAGANVSDQPEKWTKNFRCPDVVVFLAGNPAEDRLTHWLGGPDFAVEVLSPSDRSRKKFGFYAGIGVRELLLVDRAPWRLELYRLAECAFQLVGESSLDRPDVLTSVVLPVTMRLIPGKKRPRIDVTRADGTAHWLA